eukprot:TRINITY_DN5849_c0_g1_i1.p1 TRINITY_DN5849_c0_g1~~TRINITY_DN5849_c0_g1_i1.p1  ORF type:complete len:195 (-),score=50.83 TRINITY_DN5849_c0_g1_i1:144-650(-)
MWKQCRQQEKVLAGMMSERRRRAERKAAYFASKLIDPIQTLRATGSSVKIFKDSAQYQNNENRENLMPWNGKQDVLIDRYDGRALLDYIAPYDKKKNNYQMTEEEEELEDRLNYERYRSIIEASRYDLEERSVIREVEAKPVYDTKMAPTEKEREKNSNQNQFAVTDI